MSIEQAGAIIRVIFYILCVDGKERGGFDSTYISNRYNEFLNHSLRKEKIKTIIKRFKKNRISVPPMGLDAIKLNC